MLGRYKMPKCSVCNGMGLIKKEENKPKTKKIPEDYYSTKTQYGLYKECEKCIGLGITYK